MLLSRLKVMCVSAAVVLAAGSGGTALAQGSEPFSLDGETIRVLLPGSVGGMSDVQTRILVEYLGRYLPGDPDFLVQNHPGAAGVRMLEYLDELDPSEEFIFYSSRSGMPFQARAGQMDENLFDPREVNWLGSFRGSTLYCLVRSDSGVETLDDLRDQPVLFGAGSVTGNDYAIYLLLNEQLGLQIEPIVGYEDGASIALAVERGEVQGICNNYANYLQFLRPMVEAGDARILFYMGAEEREDIDAPYLFNHEMPAEAAEFMRVAIGAISFGGPYAMPEGSDPRYVEAMRDAFGATMADPEFLAATETAGIDLQAVSHDGIEEAVADLYAASDDLIGRISALFFGGE